MISPATSTCSSTPPGEMPCALRVGSWKILRCTTERTTSPGVLGTDANTPARKPETSAADEPLPPKSLIGGSTWFFHHDSVAK